MQGVLRHFDARTVAVLGFSAFAAANLWGTQLTHDWAREDFVGIVLLQLLGMVRTFVLLRRWHRDPAHATVAA